MEIQFNSLSVLCKRQNEIEIIWQHAPSFACFAEGGHIWVGCVHMQIEIWESLKSQTVWVRGNTEGDF